MIHTVPFRTLYIDSEDVAGWEFNDNISKLEAVSMIADAIFTKYFMLETIYFDESGSSVQFTNNFTDKHMVATNMAMVHIQGIVMNHVTDNFGDNWPHLEFLRLINVTPQNIPSESFRNLKYLKYLNLISNNIWYDEWNSTKVAQQLEFLCDLPVLGAIALDGNGNIVLPDCAYETNTLVELEWVSLEGAYGFNIKLIDTPNFRMLNLALSSELNRTDIFGFGNQKFGFRKNKNTEYYMQGTKFCNEYINKVLNADDVQQAT